MAGSGTTRLAVLLSGGGTTLENIFAAIDAGELDAVVARVVASRPDAGGLDRARRRGVPTAVVNSRDFRRDGTGTDWHAFSAALTPEIDAAAADLVCLAGFMCRWHLPERYRGRAINIHPALLPAFGGRGMYGHHVHAAVAAAGVKVSGCTVHFVDDEYDAGPIILQRTCPVDDGDTPEEIAARVFAEEKLAYPEAIRLFAAGRLRIAGRVVRIAPPGPAR